MFRISDILGDQFYSQDIEKAYATDKYIYFLAKIERFLGKIQLKKKIKGEEIEEFLQELTHNFSSYEQDFLAHFFQYHIKEKFLPVHILNMMFIVWEAMHQSHFKNTEIMRAVKAAFFIDISLVKFQNIVEKKSIFNQKEKDIVSRHPVLSAQIFAAIFPRQHKIKDFIYHHHSGKYKRFSSELQIVTICDEFESLTHLRSYRGKMNPARAIEKISRKFSPEYLMSLFYFVNRLGFYPFTTKVQLSNGEQALVVTQNKGFPFRPKVKVVSKGANEGNIIDLVNTPSVYIDYVL